VPLTSNQVQTPESDLLQIAIRDRFNITFTEHRLLPTPLDQERAIKSSLPRRNGPAKIRLTASVAAAQLVD
jgi:hypothetical protein